MLGSIGARPNRGRKLLTMACVAVLGSCLLGFPGCSRRSSTCAVCRQDREDLACLGLRWSQSEETDCSRWYASNVERSHSHEWASKGHCQRFGIPGVYWGYACTAGSPISGLSRRVQVEIYEHFEDRLEAKRLFLRLGRAGPSSYREFVIMIRWVGEGYPTSWHDWWEAHQNDKA